MGVPDSGHLLPFFITATNSSASSLMSEKDRLICLLLSQRKMNLAKCVWVANTLLDGN